jgi:hypothetical protein
VFRKNLSILGVTQPLEEACGALDVGEEEGDRPGRQDSQVRPPWEAE